MNGHPLDLPDTGVYRDRLDRFRQSDIERDRMVVELLGRYDELLQRYQQVSDDFTSEVANRRRYQNRVKVLDTNPFVYAIIDGDGAVFNTDLLAKGEDGGAEAAHRLQAGIKNYLRKTYPEDNVDDWSVSIQVVMNIEGLNKKLKACNLINSISDLYAFSRAFGRAQPLFNIVDVGHGKERADHKVRETFRLMARIAQCQHILFGPCHDTGYLPFLQPYQRDPVVAPKLSLLEATPAEQGFRNLGFPRVSFGDVFRSEPLPAAPAPPALGYAPINSPIEASPRPAHAFVKPPTPPTVSPATASSWAAMSKSGATTKTFDVTPSKAAPRKYYLLNSNDERVDLQLGKFDTASEQRFNAKTAKNGNFCNNFHLKGSCDNEDYCGHQHGSRLSPGELMVLRHKARGLKCKSGSWCVDVDCPYAHHCKFGRECTNDNCRFADTHHMDLRPVTRVFEDGTTAPA